MAHAITDITLVADEGGINNNEAFHRQVFHVYFSGGYSVPYLTYTPFTNGAGLTLPKANATHPGDGNAYVAGINVKAADGDGAFGGTSAAGIAEYTVTYAQKKINFDPNPLNRPPVIAWGGSDVGEVPSKTTEATPQPLNNSAGELYDGIPERPVPRLAECSITRNELPNPASNVTVYSNTTNQNAWYGVAGSNGLLGRITAGLRNEVVNGTNLAYWEVTYPMRFRADGWNWKSYDMGWMKMSGTSRVVVKDKNESLPPKATYLDGSGAPLATNGTPVIFPAAGYPIVFTSDWSGLTLPNPFA